MREEPADKAMGAFAAPPRRCALGATSHVGEAGGAVLGRDIVGHQLRWGGGSIPLHQLLVCRGRAGRDPAGQGVLHLEHQPGMTTVHRCDGPTIDHEGRRGLTRSLYCPPAQPARCVRPSKSKEPAAVISEPLTRPGGGEPRPDGVLLQRPPQLASQPGQAPRAQEVGQRRRRCPAPRGRGGPLPVDGHLPG